MKKMFLGALLMLLALSAVALGVLVHKAYLSYKLTNATATYLFSETEVKSKEGKALSRADLIDALLRDAIAKAQPTQTK